ncbi:MAG: SigB/SigF/SigG family RNA polymerase sigma factor [Candidatus Borkfalkiaceae bacterium]|nr:SigB/SigF/SigG family RNA polymerase sigma factor [Christensenellaceae bacterium]
MLNQEETLDYIRKAKTGDEKAKEQIFINNAPLLKSIIRRFKGKGVEYDDLYQIACIGFLKAVKNYDETFGVKFSTYTVPMVIGEIKRYMRDNGAIKVSRSLKILANKINRFIDAYQTEHSDSPEVDVIAKRFGITEEEVVVALDSARMPLSIFDKFEDEDDGQELIDKVPYSDGEEKILNKIQLSKILDELNERERKIIILRFYRDKTQSEIAETLGVSQVQVSRLENKIIEKMRLKF